MSSDRMSTRQAAVFLGIGLSTLYAWTAEGRIPFYRLTARRLRFDRAESRAVDPRASCPGGCPSIGMEAWETRAQRMNELLDSFGQAESDLLGGPL